MKITVERAPSVGGATLGKLYIDGVYTCRTLEDQVREIEGAPVHTWKIAGRTAIPAGVYRVTLKNSANFGPDTITLHDVPGFEYIRMHAGNTTEDTRGCLLVGMLAARVSLIGGTSRPALAVVKGEVQRAIARGEQVSIDISNAQTLA